MRGVRPNPATMREHPRVQIPISPSWQEAYSLLHIRSLLSKKIAGRLIGGTLSADLYGEGENRFEEIRSYVRRHSVSAG